jgi:hypothetical protein
MLAAACSPGRRKRTSLRILPCLSPLDLVAMLANLAVQSEMSPEYL